jgi:ABC-type nitrate/sulfonate/bicarbonate transport system permease component
MANKKNVLLRQTSQLVRAGMARAAPFLIVAIIWELSSRFAGSDFLPSVLEIVDIFVSSSTSDAIIASQGGGSSGYLPHVLKTVIHVVVGVTIGGGLGAIGALGLFQSQGTRLYIEPILESLRAVPPLILVPFVLIAFGATATAQFIICGLYAGLSLFVYTINALDNIPHEYRDIARLYGTSRMQLIRKVELPAIVPELLGGTRVTFAIALGIVIVAEYMGAPSGVGRVLKFALSFSRVDLILVGIIWAGVIGLIFDTIIDHAIRSCIRWRA